MTEAAVGRTDLPPGAASTAVLEETAGQTRATRLSTFHSLAYRDYRLLWTGTLFASAGQWIQQITVPWLAYDMTNSIFLLGAINGFRALPVLILGPFGGVAADRVERKWLLQSTQYLLLVATAILAAIIFLGQLHVWHLFAFTFVTGIAWAFNNPVRQSVVPNLVPRESLLNALALNSAAFNVTRAFGPTIGGVLLVVLGPGENFVLQALAYVCVILLVVPMVVPPSARLSEASVRENLIEGARYVWNEPQLRLQMTLALVPMVIGMPYMTLLPVFAKDILHHGPSGFGLLMSATGVGAVLGTLTLASLSNLRNKGLVLFGAIFAMGLTIVAFALSQNFLLSMAILVVAGACQMVYLTMNQTLLQMIVPDHLRGRVMGIYMLNMGLMPLGALFAGTTASAIGAPTAAAIMGGSVSLLSLVIFLRAKNLRHA
ncbi:MAG TPA: MFS transporter [Dehalococcoidia bacterium]|nr:MFS transporter [Dehalococcoidia bacterium]